MEPIKASNTTVCAYTSKDLILYALGIGCTEGDNSYLYENDEHFAAFPLFPLTMGFYSRPLHSKLRNSIQYTNLGVKPFPPPSMGAFPIPSQFLEAKDETNDILESNPYPLIHVSQSLEFYQTLPIPDDDDAPIYLVLRTSISSVKPKKVGTFVTTATDYHLLDNANSSQELKQGKRLCRATSTVLVMGMPPHLVIPYAAKPKSRSTGHKLQVNDKHNPSVFTQQQHTRYPMTIPPHQAHLYRLSGDYNPIHVDAQITSVLMNIDRPILHGLCTMGYATRALLQSWAKHNRTIALTFVSTRFTRPLPMGSTPITIVVSIDSQYTNMNQIVDSRFRVYQEGGPNQTKDALILEGVAKGVSDSLSNVNVHPMSKL